MLLEIQNTGRYDDIAIGPNQFDLVFRNPSSVVAAVLLSSKSAWYYRTSVSGTRTSVAAGTVVSFVPAATDTTYYVSAPASASLRVYVRGVDEQVFDDIALIDDLTVGGQLNTDTIAEKTADAGVTADGVLLKDSVVNAPSGGQFGLGFKIYALSQNVTAAGVETAMSTAVPKGAVILAVSAKAQSELTAGGTTTTWSLGVTGDVDKYGTAGFPTQADSLLINSKSQWMGDGFVRLTAAETLKLCAAATGGASAGDTALSVGVVKIVVTYALAEELASV